MRSMRTNESGIQRHRRERSDAPWSSCRSEAAQEAAAPRDVGRPGRSTKFLGWCVHAYTALGLVAAGLIAVLLVRGDADAFRWSFLLMAAATIVDSTDGTLRSQVRIKEVVPRLRRPAAR